MINVPDIYRPYITEAARQSGVPENVIAAYLHTESRFNPRAVSPAGAQGISQILPSTAARPGYGLEPLGSADVWNPERAIPWSARYLNARAEALPNWGGWGDPTSAQRALTAYNGGSRRGTEINDYGRNVWAGAGGVRMPEQPREPRDPQSEALPQAALPAPQEESWGIDPQMMTAILAAQYFQRIARR